MDLTALADFNLVALHGGFGPAGRALNRPKATLSRRVAELEEDLGVRLIERGARRMRLTEDGQVLHERTRGLLSELQEAGEAVASRAPIARGRLRVSAPMVFAHVVLGEVAARFALAYPQVELEITAEDRIVDPVDDGYDLVIRINPAKDGLLVGRRIMNDQRLLVATAAIPIPSTQASNDDERPVPAVVLAQTPSGVIWSIRTGNGDEKAFKPMPLLRLSSLLMVRDAVLAGVGVAMLPMLLVKQDVAAGRLICWGTEAGPPVEIWALYHSRRLLSAKVRAFLDMLKELQVPA